MRKKLAGHMTVVIPDWQPVRYYQGRYWYPTTMVIYCDGQRTVVRSCPVQPPNWLPCTSHCTR